MTKSKLTTTIGKEIAAARGLRELTQEVLARAVKVTPLYISKIETGRSRPSLELLIDISTALAVSLDSLVGRSHS